MPQLYSRLFRYRARERRAPLEDFLTEAVADLFDRLPPSLLQAFVQQLCLRSDLARQAWRETQAASRLRARTQHSIRAPRQGYIDLLIEDEAGRPLIVVESKIHSGVRSHATPTEIDAAPRPAAVAVSPEPTQLTTYEGWLRDQRKGENWPGAVLLLSHGAVPDPRYAQAATAEDGLYLGACSWREVARWLDRARRAEDAEDQHGWRALASDLVVFLEENGMDTELVTSRDLAALELMAPSYGRLQRLFEEVGKQLPELKKRTNGLKPMAVGDDGRLFWSWAFPLHAQGAKPGWWIAWAVRFPTSPTTWWQVTPPLPSRPHLLVCLGTDNTALPVGPEHLEPGWSHGDQEAAIAKPLALFSDDPETFHAEIGAWVGQELERALLILQRVAAA